MRLTRTAIAAAVLALAGCASAPVLQAPPVEITGEQLTENWTPVHDTLKRPMGQSRLRSGEVRPHADKVTVTYLIDSNGRVHDARVVSAEPANAYAGWAVDAISAFSYRPAPDNPGRVPVKPTQTLTLLPGPPPTP